MRTKEIPGETDFSRALELIPESTVDVDVLRNYVELYLYEECGVNVSLEQVRHYAGGTFDVDMPDGHIIPRLQTVIMVPDTPENRYMNMISGGEPPTKPTDPDGPMAPFNFNTSVPTLDHEKDFEPLADQPATPVKIYAHGGGLRVVLGEKPDEYSEYPNLLIERHKDGKWLIVVHSDDGDPVGDIQFRADKVTQISDNMGHVVIRDDRN